MSSHHTGCLVTFKPDKKELHELDMLMTWPWKYKLGPMKCYVKLSFWNFGNFCSKEHLNHYMEFYCFKIYHNFLRCDCFPLFTFHLVRLVDVWKCTKAWNMTLCQKLITFKSRDLKTTLKSHLASITFWY